MKAKPQSSAVVLEQHIHFLQSELVQLDGDIKTRIRQLEQCQGPMSALNQQTHIVSERLSIFESKVADLENLARSFKSKSPAGEADQLHAKIDRYRVEAAQNLHNLRRATLSAMQSIEKRERDQLLSSGGGVGGSSALRHRQVGAAGLAQHSGELTEGLTALVRHMDAQVRQSEATLTALIGSSQVLGDTEGEFRQMGATIQSSGKLLSKYGRREITDKILIFLAMLFFFGTVLYVVKKRFWQF